MTTKASIPDSTAVRVALWRALHVEVDAAPHVLEDTLGLRLVAPEPNWRERPDMNPQWTRGYRASIVGRARLIEDLVASESQKGVKQYVILGAGLDTFAERRPDLASQLNIFEIDKPDTQAWKKKRLIELGLGIPQNLHFVPVDFESGESWSEKLQASGFSPKDPTVISSTGVAMYLTREAVRAKLRAIASLAPGSTLAMTFMLPLELLPEAERPQHQMVHERARAAGTPFLSFFKPQEMLELAREVGFRKAEHFSTSDMIRKYFHGRSDGLEPSVGESVLLAST